MTLRTRTTMLAIGAALCAAIGLTAVFGIRDRSSSTIQVQYLSAIPALETCLDAADGIGPVDVITYRTSYELKIHASARSSRAEVDSFIVENRLHAERAG